MNSPDGQSVARKVADFRVKMPGLARHHDTVERPSMLSRVDPILLFSVVCLLVIGLVMVYSASAALSAEETGNSLHYMQRQVVGAVLGGLLLFLALKLPVRFYSRHAKHAILLSVVLMLLVFVPFIGMPVGGFHRWIRLIVLPFQPVEFVKLAVILYVAHFLSMGKKNMRSFSKGILPSMIVMMLFVALLIFQPDFGSAVLLCGIVFAMLLAGGARLTHLGMLGAVTAIPGYFLIATNEYRAERFRTYLKWIGGTEIAPDDKGYQIWQSYNAF
ncbi:MAG: FtsW/RodA/SpoVE family cell cycle protein, partial [Candidatus Poribacteria bacterium]|nr:FtsW/RodA/SpoVE family cell cycle protein [Candidatus Poribacteria bacterium]